MPETLDRLRAALAGRYGIVRELGAGGMATVYLADDLRHERPVAVKVLRPDLAETLGTERFLREIKIAANLHHPHILPLYDSGEADGFLFYVMPYEEGRSLREKLAHEGELPVNDAVRLLRDVVDALAHAHDHGVVHRDIKPDNVLLSGRHALVTDFGVAKAVSEATGRQGITTQGVALGTPAYMAPEQAAADPHIDHRADIYAVGVLGYELLAGRPPFTGTTAQAVLAAHVTTAADPLTKHRSAVPPALEAVLMRCLEKKPADRWQSAADLLRELETLATPSGGITPTGTVPVKGVSRATRPRWLVPAAAAAVIALAGVAAVALRSSDGRALEPNVLAIAPFDALGPDLDTWREGIVDLLSARLDGAGPIRTVPPSVALRAWDGRADAASVAALGRRVGSGLAVYGRILAEGTDSVRLEATLYDVRTGVPIGEFEHRGTAAHVPNLVDSLSVEVLAALTRDRGIAGARLRSLGSTSPAAIRAFLRGEQAYRSNALDSAGTYYQRAIEADSGFALAYNRLADVSGWPQSRSWGNPNELMLQASRLNRGLARRESLLVVADSLWAATSVAFRPDSATWARFHRLTETLEEANRLYPNDPQVIYRMAEAGLHKGWATGLGENASEPLFRRAVELDSGFAPAYLHLVELQMRTAGEATALRTARTYLQHDSTSPSAAAMRITIGMLTNPTSTIAALDFDTLSSGLVNEVWHRLYLGVDSDEADVEFLRAVQSGHDSAYRPALAHGHARRGRFAEATRTFAPDEDGFLFLDLAKLGAYPRRTVDSVFDAWLEGPATGWTYFAYPWWAAHGDTIKLRRARDLVLRVARSDTASEETRAWTEFLARQALPYLALARRDTAAALVALEDVPGPRCHVCYWEMFTKARLLAATGRDRDAVQILNGAIGPSGGGWRTAIPEPLWILERGRVNERLGNKETAVRSYAYVADLWRNADSLLQSYVTEARAGLARLTAEDRR